MNNYSYNNNNAILSDINTLFRSSSLASKLISELMKYLGHTYLQTTLNATLSRICRERKPTEVDPQRLHDGEELSTNTVKHLNKI
jgi:hypothetical protein